MYAVKVVTVRIPAELADQIKARAAEKEVSMNSWIVKALRYQYERSVQGTGAKITTEVTL